jgi:MFS family permease
MPFVSPYRAVLRTPYAGGAFAASLVGRLTYGVVSLSLVLSLTAGGRGYGLAGLVMALFGAAVVLASPFRARMIDRYGPRRALPPMAAGFAAPLAAIAVAPGHGGQHGAVTAVLAAVAGACAT